jgi:hypothetical protein
MIRTCSIPTDRRGSELRWWGGRAVADRPVLGVRGRPSTGLPSGVAGAPSGAVRGRGQHQPGRLAGRRGVRAGVAAAVIWPAESRCRAGPAAVPAGDRSVAMPCRPGPVAPGGRQVDCGKRMVDEVPPRRPGRRLPVAGERRPAVAGEFVFRFGRRRSASGWAPGEPLAGASVAVVGGNWRVPG